ncbi:MAG: tRNA (guanosine(37)-N1)-methyltransferase TrmD [Candidatus Vogelbacteria bacterium]|nr:tRNA (guanosine(37)-N1)-methyltransferase TrmD [Candidatus Vogelbacteria bacterium]
MTSRNKVGHLTFHLVTIFPEISASYWRYGVTGRAVRRGLVQIKVHNLRDYSSDGKRVDDRPYGGGPGMVFRAQPIVRAVEKIKRKTKNEKRKIIILSPAGKQFTNREAARWAKHCDQLILIAGRYEGIDARVRRMIPGAREVSVGPYVLTGGELAAMVIIDAVTRHLPGVLGDNESLEERRSASHEVYTRPKIITHRGRHYRVPKILLSGDHATITAWRKTGVKSGRKVGAS